MAKFASSLRFTHSPEEYMNIMLQSNPLYLPTSDVERTILSLIQSGKALSQRGIIAESGYKQQTVSRTVGELIDHGLLYSGERQVRGERGQPCVSLMLNPNYLYTVGVSIMADAVSVLLMDMGGNPRAYAQDSLRKMSRESVLLYVQQALRRLCEQENISFTRIIGIGVGITGFEIGGGQRFNCPYGLDDWADVDVAEVFRSAFGLPAWADNDGNVAASGENLVGIGRWSSSFAYLYIATGFGGGLVIDGALVRGSHGNAGEFAASLPQHIYASPTLELLRHCFIQYGEIYDTIGDMIANLDPYAPPVDDWLNRVGASLSLVCSACAAILDPEAIVIGGRVPRALALRMIERIDLRAAPRRGVDRPQPKLLPSEVDGDATALGAASVPLQQTVFRPTPST